MVPLSNGRTQPFQGCSAGFDSRWNHLVEKNNIKVQWRNYYDEGNNERT